MNGIRIGITIGLRHSAESLWSNGIKQNAVYLAQALRHCSQVNSVVLINTTDVAITAALPWNLEHHPTLPFDAAKDHVDVVIELGGQLDAERTAYLKQRGARLVSYCCGSEYIHTMESILFRPTLNSASIFINPRYDDIWMIPQIANGSRAYFEVLRRHPARVVPFVWSPTFLEERSTALPHAGEYQPRRGARRLTVMEPNIDVVKFCLYPTLIAEMAYRAAPEKIALLQVTNAQRLATGSAEFIQLMNQLDIVRDHKAVFLGRCETPAMLAENTDVVISHQWENPLNYFYLEVCWQGYPLIHNAHLCNDLGYFYPDNDVSAGARQLASVLDAHDTDAVAYRNRQRSLISRYLPDDPQLVAAYSALLDELVRRQIR